MTSTWKMYETKLIWSQHSIGTYTSHRHWHKHRHTDCKQHPIVGTCTSRQATWEVIAVQERSRECRVRWLARAEVSVFTPSSFRQQPDRERAVREDCPCRTWNNGPRWAGQRVWSDKSRLVRLGWDWKCERTCLCGSVCVCVFTQIHSVNLSFLGLMLTQLRTETATQLATSISDWITGRESILRGYITTIPDSLCANTLSLILPQHNNTRYCQNKTKALLFTAQKAFDC